MRRFGLAAILAATATCTPDIATDPLPEVMEFEPTAAPPRVSEPTFAVIDPGTGRINLAIAGIAVPADCASLPPEAQAQCEFNQYLQSLDGFPTTAGARTPVSAVVDPATLTPQNVAVIEARSMRPVTEVGVTFDAATRYVHVTPRTRWPSKGFVWVGVRGYDSGIRTVVQTEPRPVVASLAYNLIKRDVSLTCGAASPAEITPACGFYQLLVRGMSDVSTRASLVGLEGLRQATSALGGWTLLTAVGGIPKDQAAILWGFPIHSGPVIDINPGAGLVPVVGADTVQLVVNGALDPATVTAFRLRESAGSVILLDLAELGAGRVGTGFPLMTTSYAGGNIIIKTEAPLKRGGLYGVVVLRSVKDTTGAAMVSPPASVLLMAKGPVAGADGKSLVSSVSNAEAAAIEPQRQGLKMLLDDPQLCGFTGICRPDIAYLFGFTVPQ